MKRTLDHFFVKLRPEQSEAPQCSDTEPMPSCSNEPNNEPQLVAKKAKVYSFRKEWLGQFPWLRYDMGENVMHCIYCKECGPAMAGNSSLATGCQTFRIETLKKHGASIKHTTCRDKCTAQTPPLPAAFQRQAASNRTSEEAAMMIKFNIAYNIAKEEIPFTKFRSEIILHKKNGLDVNPTYSNDVACAQFIGIIGDTLKQKTSVEVANSTYISFLIDGDTDISTKECVIVYARVLRRGTPVNILIGHIEVEHAHAQGKHAI